MFLSLISVVISLYGWIVFLFYDVKIFLFILYKVCFYSFVDKIIVIGKKFKVRDIYSVDGIIFFTFDGGFIIVISFVDWVINILFKSKMKKDDFINFVN